MERIAMPTSIIRFGLAACSALWMFAGAALAQEIVIEDAYARGGERSGAAFMIIRNGGDEDDRLVSASSPVAGMVELHTHIEDDAGVMRMRPVEDGFAIPAQGEHALERGGDHVMFMQLSEPFPQDGTVPVTLVFERAGEVTVDIPVRMDR
jgi:copper(I)-binding protein